MSIIDAIIKDASLIMDETHKEIIGEIVLNMLFEACIRDEHRLTMQCLSMIKDINK